MTAPVSIRVRRLQARAILALLAAAWSLGTLSAAAQGPTVLHADIEGEVITPVIADFLIEGVQRAERERHEAFLVELDTPGGLDTSMRQIIQAFFDTDLPVIVYVPRGGRAASAGAIIGMSAHVLAMAPASSIGAATPVDLQGGDIGEKIINDAAAYAEDIARARGRNIEFAVDAVREARSVSSNEALEVGVIDVIAPDVPTLLEELDGRAVGENGVELRTRDAALVAHEMSLVQRTRQRLADPNLAFLFLSLGTLALIYEFANPGMGAGGVVGVILIILGMFALSVLPVNTAGVVLLILAVALFLGEVFTPGVGVFAAGGVAAMILGGLFLFEGSIGVSLALLIPIAGVVGGGVILAGRLVWRARRSPTKTGPGQVVGRRATIRRIEEGRGQVFLEGAWWQVRARNGELAAGQQVEIVDVDGLELIAEPAREAVARGEPEGEEG